MTGAQTLPAGRSFEEGPWFYPDAISVSPGSTVTLNASAAHGPCRVIVRRIGADRHTVHELTDIQTAQHEIPAHADSEGCRVAMCVARGAGAYTIYDDKHWALEGSDLYYGDTFGGDVPLLGYENDGCPIRFDDRGLPVAHGGVGVPAHLSIIAIAPATLFEPPDSAFPPAIPPENPEVLAAFAYGRTDPGSTERLGRGHAVMASFTKGNREVFNAGTTEWVHGLAANDPFVTRITRNVIERFLR